MRASVPACWSPGCPGPARGEAPDRGTSRARASRSARQQARGAGPLPVPRPLHCRPGRASPWAVDTLPALAGPCPLGLPWTSVPRQAAADGHFRLCDLWHNGSNSTSCPKKKSAVYILTRIHALAAVWSLLPPACSGPPAGWGPSPSTGGHHAA